MEKGSALDPATTLGGSTALKIWKKQKLKSWEELSALQPLTRA
jgi:hypothetical protein